MRFRRGIRLSAKYVRTVMRVPTTSVKNKAVHPRVSAEYWEQIDQMRRIVTASAPWRQVPGVHLRMTGQLPSGKNRMGIRMDLEPVLNDDGKIVELPKVRRHSRQRFAGWRDARLKELLPQLHQWSGIMPLRVPMMLYVWYWPSDRRIRDRSGMLDAIFHVLERAGIVSNDGLIEDPIWRTMELDRRSPRVELVLRPLVTVNPVIDEHVGKLMLGCPCCALPFAS